jgi:cell division septum initiation protein DivIVA
MTPEMTPAAIRDAHFRTVMRGSDPSEVARFQADVATYVAGLVEQVEAMRARLGEFADRDLKSEFEVVGNEVAAVLEAAREAAESMRERATLDAARWRSEAMSEAETALKEARSDAEALRGDAWTVGTEMLTQAVVESNRLSMQAEREAITITGEAEREAHRLVSGARREAEDLVRGATMDAEKLTSDATKAHDDMIERARRQAEASQERTRALEQRREELMAELEGVRTTLSHLEGTLEAKREDLNLSRTADSSVRVIPSNPSPSPMDAEPQRHPDWVPGETVRVVRGDDSTEPASPTQTGVTEPTIVPTVRVIPAEPTPVVEEIVVTEGPPANQTAPEAAPTSDVAPNREVENESVPELDPVPVTATPDSPDDVGALFASLRDPNLLTAPGTTAQPSAASEQPDPVPHVPALPDVPATSKDLADDLIEGRDSMLIPITNHALRGIKKAITEAQNVALDGLRTTADWKPDHDQLVEALRADLIALWSESFSAGHDMAESMTGQKLKRPPTPNDDVSGGFVAALVDSLTSELDSAGDGQRERQSAASKVFRAWRTDESERRIRQVALRGFHSGIAGSSVGRPLNWVSSGTPCSACRDAAGDPAAHVPPVHAGCECMVATV